jgi:hypothetical protein
MSQPIRTGSKGKYICNNDLHDLQRFLLHEAIEGEKLGFHETSDFLHKLVSKLEKLKD